MTSFILSMRSHTSENFLNEIKIYIYIYILHRAKEITKEVYNSIINSIKL